MSNLKIRQIILISSLILFSFVLITAQIASNILARYTTNDNDVKNSHVATFEFEVDVTDITNDINIVDTINYEFVPDTKLNVDINLNGDQNQVKVKYLISFSTLNNLPLEIKYNSIDLLNNNLTGELNSLESILIDDIIIEWSSEDNSYLYSGQIDLITINVVVEQID